MNTQTKIFSFLILFTIHFSSLLAQPEISLILDVDPTSDVGLEAYGHYFITAGNTCYFSADDGVNGREMWRTDGTPEGTSILTNLNTGDLSSTENIVAFDLNGELYFLANDSLTSSNIWKTDGTQTGTVRVTDIPSGWVGGAIIPPPILLAVYDDWVYFSASDSITVYQLWRTNGTPDGIEKVSDTYLGASTDLSNEMVIFNDLLYFWARGTSSSLDRQLWRTDGTDEGTFLVRNIVTQSEADTPENLTAAGNKMYFAGDEDGTTGNELWVSDGTTAGTYLLKDLTPGPVGSKAKYFTAFGDMVYFVANDKVWRTDGTNEGTLQIGSFYVESTAYSKNPFFVFDNKLFLSAVNENNNLGRELYTINGDFITVFTEFITGDEGGSPRNFIAFDNELIFNAKGEGIGQELWQTDGTTAGTVLLADIEEGFYSSRPQDFTIVGDVLLFTAINSITGRDLYSYRDLTSDIQKISTNELQLHAFPNPNNGHFTIQNIPNQENKKVYCKFIGTGGRLIKVSAPKEVIGNSIQLNISESLSGVYFYFLYDEEDKLIGEGKFVKY